MKSKANVIELHPAPTDEHEVHADAVVDFAESNLKLIKDQSSGRIIFGAVVLVNDKGDAITHYAGETRIFTATGALHYMIDRITRENRSRDDD